VTPAAPRRLGVLMAVYLLGIFMGAIDTGIVTPARTIIQNDLGVDEQTGIWMLTIYTLAYAASIPVMGKLADRYGRKPIYLLSITLFGVGSLLCGLSQDVGSFGMLIAARAVQAIGGGVVDGLAGRAVLGRALHPQHRVEVVVGGYRGRGGRRCLGRGRHGGVRRRHRAAGAEAQDRGEEGDVQRGPAHGDSG